MREKKPPRGPLYTHTYTYAGGGWFFAGREYQKPQTGAQHNLWIFFHAATESNRRYTLRLEALLRDYAPAAAKCLRDRKAFPGNGIVFDRGPPVST